MANGQIVAIGLLLIILAVAGYITPLSVTMAETTLKLSIPQVVAICDSGLGQLAQLSAQVVMVCSEYKNFLMGIYGAGIVGVILLIVGAVKSGNKEESKPHDSSEEELEDEYEKGKISLGEFVAKTKNEEEDDSLEILKKRYAKGEISKEEFENMKKDLE